MTYTPIQQASNSTLNLQVKPESYKILGIGRGSACESRWFGFFLGTSEFAFEEATKRAIASRQGNHLIQVTSDVKMTNAFFYLKFCVVVRGIVVELKPLVGEQAPVLADESLNAEDIKARQIDYSRLVAEFSNLKSNQYVTRLMLKNELEAAPFKLPDPSLAVFEGHVPEKPNQVFYIIVDKSSYFELSRPLNTRTEIRILYRLENILNSHPVVRFQKSL